MISDFLSRIHQEATVSATGLRESLVSVADRVNRKIQIMKLHAQSSSIESQIVAHYVNLGTALVEHLPSEPAGRRALFLPANTAAAEPRLASAASQVQRLRRELQRLAHSITEIETDNLTDTLLRMHRDLSTREAAVERSVVPPRSAVAGLSARDFETSTQTRLVALCRGPALLTSFEHVALAAGDVMFFLGPRTKVRAAAALIEAPNRGHL
jgi:hypothetical protein